MARYKSLVVYINKVSQVELQTVEVNFDSKKIPVNTRKGHSGFTPGAKNMTITFKSAVPLEGPEFDPIEACGANEEYTVEVPYGKKTAYSVGEFTQGTLSGGVEQSTDIGFTFVGTYPPPK